MGGWGKILSALMVAGMAGGCGSSKLEPTAVAHGQRSVLPDVPPAQAYTMLARQIKGCWFKAGDPVLPNHIFRAEVPPSGAVDPKTSIVIYTKAPDGRLGLKAYTVLLEPRGKGTVVTTENKKLPYAMAQKLTSDVGYWIQGGANCDGPVPASGGAQGAVAVPRDNR